MKVLVRNGEVMMAYKVLQKKLHREGVYKTLQSQEFFVKPSVKKRLKKAQSIARKKKEQEQKKRLLY